MVMPHVSESNCTEIADAGDELPVRCHAGRAQLSTAQVSGRTLSMGYAGVVRPPSSDMLKTPLPAQH
jgi:hypothetical protein